MRAKGKWEGGEGGGAPACVCGRRQDDPITKHMKHLKLVEQPEDIDMCWTMVFSMGGEWQRIVAIVWSRSGQKQFSVLS